MKLLRTIPSALLCALCLASCSDHVEQTPQAQDELMTVGDSVLTRAAVEAQIPHGLSPADSAAMFDAIVETWLERSMLVNMAGGNIPDLDKIDRMVEQYRLQLLANEYRNAMARDHVSGVSPDSIKAYYDAHPEKFLLESPAVKGIYLKVPGNSAQIDKVRKLMSTGTPDAIDELETEGLKGALEYDYFGDSWVDWQVIADRIPYRFGDADSFVASHKFFETDSDGIVYMLRLIEYTPSGELMPLDLASAQIQEEIMDKYRADYDRSLLQNLYNRGVRQKDVVPGSYIPKKYRK